MPKRCKEDQQPHTKIRNRKTLQIRSVGRHYRITEDQKNKQTWYFIAPKGFIRVALARRFFSEERELHQWRECLRNILVSSDQERVIKKDQCSCTIKTYLEMQFCGQCFCPVLDVSDIDREHVC